MARPLFHRYRDRPVWVDFCSSRLAVIGQKQPLGSVVFRPKADIVNFISSRADDYITLKAVRRSGVIIGLHAVTCLILGSEKRPSLRQLLTMRCARCGDYNLKTRSRNSPDALSFEISERVIPCLLQLQDNCSKYNSSSFPESAPLTLSNSSMKAGTFTHLK